MIKIMKRVWNEYPVLLCPTEEVNEQEWGHALAGGGTKVAVAFSISKHPEMDFGA